MTENLAKQVAELTGAYEGLVQVAQRETETILSGALAFEVSADGLETISETFDIELAIPHTFPDRLPQAKANGGRIGTDYEHVFTDGTLCLAVPIEQRRVFFEQPTLLGFVDRLLVPYLYGYCFWRKHGYHPFEEAAHGSEGILRHYLDTLGFHDPLAALAAICFLYEHGYRGHHGCPCGSGRIVRACHGPRLRALHDHHTPETLRGDFLAIFDVCYARFQQGQLSFPSPLLNQLVRLREKVQGLSQRVLERRRRTGIVPVSPAPSWAIGSAEQQVSSSGPISAPTNR